MRGLESRVEKRIEKHRRAQERREREKTANQSRVEKRGDDERREEERIEGMIMKKLFLTRFLKESRQSNHICRCKVCGV